MPVLEYRCRDCAWSRRHGYGWLGAEVALGAAESEYETLAAQRQSGRRLIDVPRD